MAAAAVAEFQRAQSLLGTDRNASIDILHSIGKYDGHGSGTGEKTTDRSVTDVFTSPSDAERLS